MKAVTSFAFAVLAASALASAQMGGGQPGRPQGGGQMMGGGQPQTISLAAGLQRQYANIKQNLTGSAEAMAETDYGFKPAPEIRAFAQLFGHVSNAMFAQCSAARGEANPNQGKNLEEQAAKADVTKSLAAAFAFCDPAFASLTDQRAAEMVKQGNNTVARGNILAGLVAHDNEMYGTSAVYLRLKGKVPPSTERMQQMQRRP